MCRVVSARHSKRLYLSFNFCAISPFPHRQSHFRPRFNCADSVCVMWVELDSVCVMWVELDSVCVMWVELDSVCVMWVEFTVPGK